MKILFEIVKGLISTLTTALVFMKLWAWFIVPLHIPALGYAHAFGVVQIVHLFITTSMLSPWRLIEVHRAEKDPSYKTSEWVSWIFRAFVVPLIAYGTGALCHSFMVTP